MPFTPLGDTLHEDKSKTNGKTDEQDEILEKGQNVLLELFGADLGKAAKPLFVKNRTMTISCSNSEIAKEIRENQQDIVAKINDKYGSKEIDRIRYLA